MFLFMVRVVCRSSTICSRLRFSLSRYAIFNVFLSYASLIVDYATGSLSLKLPDMLVCRCAMAAGSVVLVCATCGLLGMLLALCWGACWLNPPTMDP